MYTPYNESGGFHSCLLVCLPRKLKLRRLEEEKKKYSQLTKMFCTFFQKLVFHCHQQAQSSDIISRSKEEVLHHNDEQEAAELQQHQQQLNFCHPFCEEQVWLASAAVLNGDNDYNSSTSSILNWWLRRVSWYKNAVRLDNMSSTTFVDRIDPFAKRSLKKKTKKSQGSSRYRNSQDVELQQLPLLKGERTSLKV